MVVSPNDRRCGGGPLRGTPGWRSRQAVRMVLAGLAAVLACAGPAGALGPHEVVLLVNSNSPWSVRIGETYARMRLVPDANVIRLALPMRGSDPPDEITPAEFRRLILEPVLAAIEARRLGGHVQAWVYSSGFPPRVAADPPLSLTGMTFVKGAPPPRDEVAKGTFVSPLYAGPEPEASRVFDPRSMDVLADWLGPSRPVPAMMLGFAGERGSAPETVIASLVRGVDSDGTHPTGTVYFVSNRDVRSRSRSWQFAGAVEELRRAGVAAQIVGDMPATGAAVIGLMAGDAVVNPRGIRFLPGAYADHLTSMGAAFDVESQTKCTAWLDAGATATAGAVTEPYAIWTKFPNARVFVHLAAGCTVLESVYQALRSPLQVLVLGDPLAAPWAPQGEVKVSVSGPVGGRLRVRASAAGGAGRATWGEFRTYVDGVEAEHTWPDGETEADVSQMGEGEHEVRVVAYATGLVRWQAFSVATFRVGGASEGGGVR